MNDVAGTTYGVAGPDSFTSSNRTQPTRSGSSTCAKPNCGPLFASGGYSGSRYNAKTSATIGRIRFHQAI
jgi:hypothetical protein